MILGLTAAEIFKIAAFVFTIAGLGGLVVLGRSSILPILVFLAGIAGLVIVFLRERPDVFAWLKGHLIVAGIIVLVGGFLVIRFILHR